MDKNDINFCNCGDCKYEQICCSSDAWSISLTLDETKKYPHSKLPNGQFVIASAPDGYCIFRDPATGKCRSYNDRPTVCRRFTCKDRDKEMETLLNKHRDIRRNLDATHSGFFIAFIFKTDKQKMTSSLIIRDTETGNEIQLMPQQVFGMSEDEVKDKIKEIISQPFKKESL
jgi:Fe-S-cluster containining protein